MLWGSDASLTFALLIYTDRATSSRWLPMSWRQIGARSSATTMLSQPWVYCHMRHCVTAYIMLQPLNNVRERSGGRHPVGLFDIGGFTFSVITRFMVCSYLHCSHYLLMTWYQRAPGHMQVHLKSTNQSCIHMLDIRNNVSYKDHLRCLFFYGYHLCRVILNNVRSVNVDIRSASKIWFCQGYLWSIKLRNAVFGPCKVLIIWLGSGLNTLIMAIDLIDLITNVIDQYLLNTIQSPMKADSKACGIFGRIERNAIICNVSSFHDSSFVYQRYD